MSKKLENKECAYCWACFKPTHNYNKYCSVECARKGRSTLGDNICEHCWKKFKVENKWQKFCSIECRKAAVALPVIRCPICEKEVKATYKWQVYCSIACSNKSRKTFGSCKNCWKPCPNKKVYCCEECRIIWYKNSRKKAKICPTCWKEFFHKENKYCSKECLKEASLQKKRAECLTCWKIYIKGYTAQKYCSRECKYEAFRLPKKECLICWKLFHSNKQDAKYCSRECFLKSREDYNIREGRMEHLRNTPKTIITQPNLELKAYLEWLWYSVLLEYKLWWYSYDLDIWDTLIEVNPYPYHNTTRYPYWSGRVITKDYHYNKYICAKELWYKCIMVWDWTSYEDLIRMIEDKWFHYEWPPRLHRYNWKTKEHIVDKDLNKEDMLSKWFVEIYDCWQEVFTTKINNE